MVALQKIDSFSNKYSENLLSEKSLLKDTSVNFITNSGNYELTTDKAFCNGSKIIKIYTVQHLVNGVDVLFDFSDSLSYTAVYDGNYIFQFSLFNYDVNVSSGYYVNLKLKVFIDNILLETFENPVNLFDFEEEKYYTFAQNIFLITGQEVNFKFEIERPSIGSPNPNFTLGVGGFKLELDDKFIMLPTCFSKPLDQLTGWQSKVDTINTQNLTANTDNLIAFTGTDASNGSLTLMNSVGKITPIKMGDALAVDFVFTFPSPVGTTDYLSVKLKVNGVVYRAQSFSILEPTGETNYVAVSFNLPVETDFYTYGAEFFVNPNMAITISNRYLQVTRVHKGV